MGNVSEGSTGSAEEQIIEEARGVESDDIERLGHGEDDVKVGHREKLGPSSIEPAQPSGTAALRTAAIAAGMPEDVLEAADVAELPLAAESRRATRADGPESFALHRSCAVSADEDLATSPDNRAEIVLGVHRSGLR